MEFSGRQKIAVIGSILDAESALINRRVHIALGWVHRAVLDVELDTGFKTGQNFVEETACIAPEKTAV